MPGPSTKPIQLATSKYQRSVNTALLRKPVYAELCLVQNQNPDSFLSGVSLDSREDPYYNETVKSKLLNFIKKGGLSYTVAELSQPGSGVLDIFLVPSTASTGLDSTTVFFVDSNHSHVSFVSKMNHKPHW